MYEFTTAQQQKALFWLVLFHILIIAASNYLVQFPFKFSAFTPLGARFLSLHLPCHRPDVRIFGSHLARRIIFWVMFPALLLSYIFSVFVPRRQLDWLGHVVSIQHLCRTYRLGQLCRLCARTKSLIFFVFNKITSSESVVDCSDRINRHRQRPGYMVFFAIAFYASSDEILWRQAGRASLLSIICSNSLSAPSSSCRPTV